MCGYACINCGACGKETNRKPYGPGVCEKCGEVNIPSSKVCNKCGETLPEYPDVLPPGVSLH